MHEYSTFYNTVGWQHQGQRQLKNEFLFNLRISQESKFIQFVYHSQSYPNTEYVRQRKIREINFKNWPRGSGSLDREEFGNFKKSYYFVENG